MKVTKIDKHIHMIDLEPSGIENFAASYVVRGGRKTAIIESGPASAVENLLSGLKELEIAGWEVSYVAVSHVHLDHSGGIGTLLEHLPKAMLIVHPRGAPHIANPEVLWTKSSEALGEIAQKYGAPWPVPEERIISATDDLIFDLGNNVGLKVVETLGHASHHLAYYETLSEALFTGDSAGIYLNSLDVVVPTSPSPFRLDLALDSLKRLISLRSNFLCYSHFGKAERPAEKLHSYISQLKLWEEIAAQELEKGHDLDTIKKEIVKSDEALQKAGEYIRNHPILRETILDKSIEGIVKYVKESQKS